MKRVAIIGAGIVGATVAYRLAKNNVEVKVFDASFAQGTAAAVGIICPWVNQRRNKKWYALANEGAHYYHELIQEVPDQDFYKMNGTLITHPTRLDKLYELAVDRFKSAPAMKRVSLLDSKAVASILPEGFNSADAIFVEGGAQVDGRRYVETLLSKSNLRVEYREVKIVDDAIDGIHYDAIVIACGPWVNEVSDTTFEVYPQKGQLVEIHDRIKQSNYPVIMPHGELDILFGNKGEIVIGASHENHKSDTYRDEEVEARLINDARLWIPNVDVSMIDAYRIGIRAYTAKNEPFFGPINDKGIYVASGLGSSGLTVGPIIGEKIAQAILGKNVDFKDFDPKFYIKKA